MHGHQYRITAGKQLRHARGHFGTGWWLNLETGGVVQNMLAVDRDDGRQVMRIWLASRIGFDVTNIDHARRLAADNHHRNWLMGLNSGRQDRPACDWTFIAK